MTVLKVETKGNLDAGLFLSPPEASSECITLFLFPAFILGAAKAFIGVEGVWVSAHRPSYEVQQAMFRKYSHIIWSFWANTLVKGAAARIDLKCYQLLACKS